MDSEVSASERLSVRVLLEDVVAAGSPWSMLVSVAMLAVDVVDSLEALACESLPAEVIVALATTVLPELLVDETSVAVAISELGFPISLGRVLLLLIMASVSVDAEIVVKVLAAVPKTGSRLWALLWALLVTITASLEVVNVLVPEVRGALVSETVLTAVIVVALPDIVVTSSADSMVESVLVVEDTKSIVPLVRVPSLASELVAVSLPKVVDEVDNEELGAISGPVVEVSLVTSVVVLVDRSLTKSGSLTATELCDKEFVDVCTTEEPVPVAADVNMSEAVSAAVPDDIWLDELLEAVSGNVLVTLVDETEERLVGTVAEVSDGDAEGLNAETVDEVLGASLSVMVEVTDSKPGRIENADEPTLSTEDVMMVVALVWLGSTEIKTLLDSVGTPIVVETGSSVGPMVAVVLNVGL